MIHNQLTNHTSSTTKSHLHTARSDKTYYSTKKIHIVSARARELAYKWGRYVVA